MVDAYFHTENWRSNWSSSRGLSLTSLKGSYHYSGHCNFRWFEIELHTTNAATAGALPNSVSAIFGPKLLGSWNTWLILRSLTSTWKDNSFSHHKWQLSKFLKSSKRRVCVLAYQFVIEKLWCKFNFWKKLRYKEK